MTQATDEERRSGPGTHQRDPVPDAAGVGESQAGVQRLRGPRVAALVLGAAIGLALLLSVVAFAADQAAHTGKVSRNGLELPSLTPGAK